jgi:GGDEF domain-containing protein
MGDRDLLSDLSKTVAAYLNTVQTVAECLEVACPEVGRPYHSRIQRLRARVAFEATPAAIDDSAATLAAELSGYAVAASGYMEAQNRELRRGIATLEKAAEALAKRVEFYGSSLRQLTARIENADYPADPDQLKPMIASQADALRKCIESMTHENASLIDQSRAAIRESAVRLTIAQVTDDTTGAISRPEMERQIEARRAADVGFTPLLIELKGDVDDGVMRQAAAKLSSRFRHNDLLGRWSEREFMLLFHGNPDLAGCRVAEALPWISGAYADDGGGTVQIEATVSMLDKAPTDKAPANTAGMDLEPAAV